MKASRFWSGVLMGVGVLLLAVAGGAVAWRALAPAGQPAATVWPTATAWPTVQPTVAVAAPTHTAQRETPAAAQPTASAQPTATASPTATDAMPATGATPVTASVTPAPGSPTPTASATASATATSSATASPTASPTASRTPTLSATVTAPRLVIAKIDVNAAIVEVPWRVVQTGDGPAAVWDVAPPHLVGHHLGSARLGEEGNVVLSGHGSDDGSLARLEELEEGDLIRVYATEADYRQYRVVETHLLADAGAAWGDRLAHANYMAPTEDARLTLITCWPAWAYTHRLVVVARGEPR